MVVLTFQGLVLSDHSGMNVRVERKWIAGESIETTKPCQKQFLGGDCDDYWS